MTLTTYPEIEQRSEEWYKQRCGIVTASVVGTLITPKTLKVAANDTSRNLTAQLVAERITGYVEPSFTSSDMERGNLDEPYARDAYAEKYSTPVQQVGFMVREENGYKLGYSPDGLVGDDGLIEIKSRQQKIQLATFLRDEVPIANMAQIQCGLLVSGRKWCDYVSYCGGMPLFVKRVQPDENWRMAIVAALMSFEADAAEMTAKYLAAVEGLPTTERIEHFAEMEF